MADTDASKPDTDAARPGAEAGKSATDESGGAAKQDRPLANGKRGKRTARTQANVKGQGMATLPQDGGIARVLMEERRERVAELARDGFGVREIARRLAVAPSTVVGDVAVLEREAIARMRKHADAWRDSVLERLDDTRTRLLQIARGSLDNVGVSDRISAERALILAESQRAKVLGLHKQADDEAMAGFVQALVTRRKSDADVDAVDVDIVDAPANTPPPLPPPADYSAANPAQVSGCTMDDIHRLAAKEARVPMSPVVKEAVGDSLRLVPR